MKAWDFASATYARAGVKAAALELQDAGGQCVSLLLWRLWAAVEGRTVDATRFAEALSAAKALEADILRPSRRLRARLKAGPQIMDAAARSAAYRLYLEAELAAERGLIEGLERLTGGPGAAATDPLTCLEETARAWGGDAPRGLLAKLADAC